MKKIFYDGMWIRISLNRLKMFTYFSYIRCFFNPVTSQKYF